MSKLSSVLTQAQKDSLEIENFIFHIIDPDRPNDDEIVELDEVRLESAQKKFFLDRLREVAEGTQYKFLEDAVNLKEKCESIISTPNDFVKLSRQLTRDFSGRHRGSMSAGIFIVCQVSYLATRDNKQQLIFLLKMDKQQSFSYSYKTQDGKRIAIVKENPNALNESKTAVQKCALIDVSDEFDWDVLAFDKSAKPHLTDYFKAFLGVVERDTNSNLTRTAISTVRKWIRSVLKDSPEDIPDGEDKNTYTSRANDYLFNHDAFDTDAYIDTVVKDTDRERKARLSASLRHYLTESGVAGQTFEPSPGSLTASERSVKYKTVEGVTITIEGSLDAAGFKITELGGGRKQVTITTEGIEEA